MARSIADGLTGLKAWGALLPYIAVLILVFIFPVFAPRYPVYLAALIMITALYAQSFNLLFNNTGLLSFGQGAFYAAGGYGFALALTNFTDSWIFAFFAGVALAGVTALIFGIFCVRNTRIYFVMLTLALGMLFYTIVFEWRDVTGGYSGLHGFARGYIGPLQLGLYSSYYLVTIVALVCFYILRRITNSPFGLILQGIKNNENRVSFAGIPVKAYRLLSFILAGLFAGVAGALYTTLAAEVDPSLAYWSSSAQPVVITLIGGPAYFLGPIVGATIYVLISDFAIRYTEYWIFIVGIVLLVAVLIFRGGIMGFIYGLHFRRTRNSISYKDKTGSRAPDGSHPRDNEA